MQLAPYWQCGPHRLDLARPILMGIINVTPDSFSDGGSYPDPGAAATAALKMLEDGAAIIDIGGESTRPGARPVPFGEELSRTIPVISELHRRAPNALISIDTTKSEVARQALAAGACIVNDISAATADAAMLEIVRALGAGLVLMHMQGTPETMQLAPHYADVAAEVETYLAARLAAAIAAGIPAEAIVLDPGLGFGKSFEHNLALFHALPRFTQLPRPILLGPSRKSFLGRISGSAPSDPLPETIAACLTAASAGVRVLRVHDPAPVRHALDVAAALAPPHAVDSA